MLEKISDILMKILIFITIGLWILALVKPDLIKDFIEWIRWVILVMWDWNYLILFITWIIESFPVLWVVVPGQNIMLIVWWFFSEQSNSTLIYVMIITSLWAIIWNYTWFLLGRYYWEKFFKKYWLWFGIWETEVSYLKKWIKKWWPWWIIFWKFHNLTRAFVPFIAWSMWMKHKSFIIYNVVWSIIWSIVIILLWVIFAKTYETIVDYLWYIMMWIMVIVGLYIWRFKKKEFLKYIEEKNKEIESKM